MMKNEQLNQLLYEALETEMGGVQVYESAIRCATNDDLKGSRELWIQSLGLPAVIPPPEEEKDFKTPIGAARAKQNRKEML